MLSRNDMMQFAEDAGFLPNTILHWEPALRRLTDRIERAVLDAADRARRAQGALKRKKSPRPAGEGQSGGSIAVVRRRHVRGGAPACSSSLRALPALDPK
jgi:hypothetical protein